jgi:hypothetical protein
VAILRRRASFVLRGLLLALLLGESKGLDFLYSIAALLILASLGGVKLNGGKYEGGSDADVGLEAIELRHGVALACTSA